MLAPLGRLHGWGTDLRRAAYERGLLKGHSLRSPVISIGGIAMGGSMKTPVVVELARALHERGPAVGVIGHGYRGAARGLRVVSDGERPLETVETVGDEAILLADALPWCPIVVGRDKVAAGRLLEQRFGRRLILVDSGFQHLRLSRDLDIVCVSEGDLEDKVVPAGLLRESQRALRSAGLVFTDRETDGPRVEALRAARRPDVFSVARVDFRFLAASGPPHDGPPPERAFAFCGVGRPERFVENLAAQGVSVVGHRFFRDHHPFTDHDLKEVTRAALTAGAGAVVTTPKDAVRVRDWPTSLPFLVLSSRLDIENLPAVLKRIDRVVVLRLKAGVG